ncbi:MAG: IS4 family transposase [Deltaproteobacteria bacterium]|nr:IS4 family transposase [Deltaproteobacteria bacterium]
MLAQSRVDVWRLSERWVPFVVGNRDEVVVNLDWTEFDADDHSMLVASLQTSHGRATPLLWKTVDKSALEGRRNDYEDELISRLAAVMPADVKITLVTNRKFSDNKLYALLKGEYGWNYLIRFRRFVTVTDSEGTSKSAREWLDNKKIRVLHRTTVTTRHCPVSTIVLVYDKAMAEPWCIVCGDPAITAAQAKKLDGKRFSCEETFPDLKDLRYGMGLKWTSLRLAERRDRVMLFGVLAHALVTLLRAAGERAGLDRLLKSNTAKKRTMSLFRQGLRWYELLPNMPEERLCLLMEAYHEVLLEHEIAKDVQWVIQTMGCVRVVVAERRRIGQRYPQTICALRFPLVG